MAVFVFGTKDLVETDYFSLFVPVDDDHHLNIVIRLPVCTLIYLTAAKSV